MKASYLSCTATNCRKTFRNESSLQDHLNQNHSGCNIEPTVGYKCKKCKRVLCSQQSLKEHSYTHTGKKPYKCREAGCGKFFRHSSQLSYHKRIHIEAKKYFSKILSGEDEKNIDDHQLVQEFESLQTEKLVESLELPKITTPQADVKLPSMFEKFLNI